MGMTAQTLRGSRFFRRVAPALLLILSILCPPLLHAADPPSAVKVNGSLTRQDGVRILRVWGTPHERGYAHGALLAQDILVLLDRFLTEGGVRGGLETYEGRILPMIGLMKIEPAYREELQGLLAGVQAVLGNEVEVPSLRRPLRYEDLVAVNCIPDFARMGCSSFAVWGNLAEGGGVLTGRNLDWNTLAPLQDAQIILVHQLDPDGKAVGWVSVTWPCVIGCLTGMNAEGVTVAMHDVWADPPTDKFGFTPRGLALREAIEAAHARTAAKDVARVLRSRRCAVGNNVMVTWPYSGKGTPAIVFEYDGNRENSQGLTPRKPTREESKEGGHRHQNGKAASPPPAPTFQVCTNHYRLRAGPSACERYEGIVRYLSARHEAGRVVTVDDAWKALDRVSLPRGEVRRIMTYHSVVFEPNLRRMHVALSSGDRSATSDRPVLLDAAALLRGTREASSVPPAAYGGGPSSGDSQPQRGNGVRG